MGVSNPDGLDVAMMAPYFELWDKNGTVRSKAFHWLQASNLADPEGESWWAIGLTKELGYIEPDYHFDGLVAWGGSLWITGETELWQKKTWEVLRRVQ
jgi:hypothetical protein